MQRGGRPAPEEPRAHPTEVIAPEPGKSYLTDEAPADAGSATTTTRRPRMIRFLFRILATFALAVAVIMAVIDATRSIAASHWVVTSLARSWSEVSPDTFEAAAEFTRDVMMKELWDPVALTVLSLPGFVIFLALALLLYLIGRRPQRRLNRFAIS